MPIGHHRTGAVALPGNPVEHQISGMRWMRWMRWMRYWGFLSHGGTPNRPFHKISMDFPWNKPSILVSPISGCLYIWRDTSTSLWNLLMYILCNKYVMIFQDGDSRLQSEMGSVSNKMALIRDMATLWAKLLMASGIWPSKNKGMCHAYDFHQQRHTESCIGYNGLSQQEYGIWDYLKYP